MPFQIDDLPETIWSVKQVLRQALPNSRYIQSAQACARNEESQPTLMKTG